jgi:hypothetical protein
MVAHPLLAATAPPARVLVFADEFRFAFSRRSSRRACASARTSARTITTTIVAGAVRAETGWWAPAAW